MPKTRVTRQGDIGKRLSEACNKKNITYYVLAQNSGVPLTTLLHIVDGTTKNPGIYTVLQLCRALNVNLVELVEDVDEGEKI